jgi:hypothetical protein
MTDNDVLKDEPNILDYKVKEATQIVTDKAEKVVLQYLNEYIWMSRINPLVDIMAISTQEGIMYRDIKNRQDIVFRSFINCETKDMIIDIKQTFKIKVEKFYG